MTPLKLVPSCSSVTRWRARPTVSNTAHRPLGCARAQRLSRDLLMLTHRDAALEHLDDPPEAGLFPHSVSLLLVRVSKQSSCLLDEQCDIREIRERRSQCRTNGCHGGE
jgi:hypothetical protein